MVEYKNGKVLNKQTENGYWWVENNIFFEYNPKLMSMADKYKFVFLSDKEIKFSTIILDKTADLTNSEQSTENYSFVDKKIE